MKTKEQADAKAQGYLSDLPSGWIYVSYQVDEDALVPDAGEWFFTLVKGPISLFPLENCTRWIARVGEKKGEISGPWQTEGDSITIKGALEKEGRAVQAYTEKYVKLLINMNEALKGIKVGDVL